MSTSPPSPPPYAVVYTPQRGNGPAVASLVLGLVLCIPGLTGLLAVIFGIVGIRKTRNPQVGGKGLAIAGLVLGLLNLVGWSGFSGLMYAAYRGSAPAREEGRQFVTALSAGDLDAALARCAPGMKREDLAEVVKKMKDWGPLQDLTYFGFFANYAGGATRYELSAIASFKDTVKSVTITVVQTGDSHKIAQFNFE